MPLSKPTVSLLKKIVLLILASVAVSACGSALAESYLQFLFTPLQSLRSAAFRLIPFSIGDVLYCGAILALLWLTIKAFARLRKPIGKNLAILVLKASVVCLSLNLGVQLLWGINYDAPKLSRKLHLDNIDSIRLSDLKAFDENLVERLKQLSPQVRAQSTAEINARLQHVYENRSAVKPLVKHSLMGGALQYLGVEGYYNPFTGEGQIGTTGTASFMQPFVAAHEMAHQTGIAAEDDANLMAYIICSESQDPSTLYSGYFNIWLYVHRRVYLADSVAANNIKKNLDERSLARLAYLRQLRAHYTTWIDEASSFLFDAYLKMGKQKDGIKTYRNVAYSALAWENKRRGK